MPKHKIKKSAAIMIILMAGIVFCFGISLIYQSSLRKGNLERIDATLLSQEIVSNDCVYGIVSATHTCYSLLFHLGNTNVSYGISLGGQPHAEDNLMNSMSPGQTYSFFVDPATIQSNGANLGVLLIMQSDRILFKQQTKFSLVGGIILLVLSSGLLVLLYTKRKQVG